MPASNSGNSPNTAPCSRDDLLRAGGVLVDLGVGRRRDGRRCGSSSCLPSALRTLNVPDRLRAELGRAVHQVLEVRRGERPAGRRSGTAASRRFQSEPSGGSNVTRTRTPFEAARPHQRRRHVHVRVRGVDAEVRAVDVVAEDLVDDAHGAVVLGDVPLVRVGP